MSSAGLNVRNFSHILAKHQGGVIIRPGESRSINLTGEEVKSIFGTVPAAYAAYGFTITVRPIANNAYRLTVRRTR